MLRLTPRTAFRNPSRPHLNSNAYTVHAQRARVPRAAGSDSPMPEVRMTVDEANKLLGVKPNASFEEIVVAKNALLGKAGDDRNKIIEVEAAYDLLFNISLKKRMTGELEISSSVRYADVPSSPPKRQTFQQRSSSSTSTQKPAVSKLPSAAGMQVAIQAPSKNLAITQSAVFAGVAVWGLAQALLESPDAQLADTAGLQMAVALAYSIYSMKEDKRMGIGKAAGLSLACLMTGAILGTVIQNWIRVDIVPLGSFSSPGVFVTEIIISTVAAGALFLV